VTVPRVSIKVRPASAPDPHPRTHPTPCPKGSRGLARGSPDSPAWAPSRDTPWEALPACQRMRPCEALRQWPLEPCAFIRFAFILFALTLFARTLVALTLVALTLVCAHPLLISPFASANPFSLTHLMHSPFFALANFRSRSVSHLQCLSLSPVWSVSVCSRYYVFVALNFLSLSPVWSLSPSVSLSP